jgi:hypothetical protein
MVDIPKHGGAVEGRPPKSRRWNSTMPQLVDAIRLQPGCQGHRGAVFGDRAGGGFVALVLSWLMRLQLGFPG